MSRMIKIVVLIELDEEADAQEVVSEMDYNFRHPAIRDTEIIDLITDI